MLRQSRVSSDKSADKQRGIYSESPQERSERMKKMKNIRKQKVKEMRLRKAQENLEKNQPISREMRKQMQKEKNRMAAQISRDRQKKYLESLQTQIQEMQKVIQNQLCKKCKAPISDHSTSEDQEITHKAHSYEIKVEQNIFQEEEIQELPFIRVPFEKSQVGFGKFGSFFCLCMLILAVVCFSNSVGDESEGINHQLMNYGKGRIMQEVDICEKKINDPYSIESSNYYNLPTLPSGWPIISHETGQYPSEDTDQCKNDFWDAYLQSARTDLAIPGGRNFANCNSPSLVRISSPSKKENEENDETWTFIVSNPTISHAHLTETGDFQVDQINYMHGVYEMVSQKVVLRKVIGDNCLA